MPVFGTLSPGEEALTAEELARLQPGNALSKGWSMLGGIAMLPKRVIDAAAVAPAAGLRREDFTDLPANTAPDPNSPLGGVGVSFGRIGWQPGDELIGQSLETAANVMGGTSLSAPARAAGEVALGAGPVRDPAMWHGISKLKLPKPISEMSAVHVPNVTDAERVVAPSLFQGGKILPLLGDRTIAGTDLAQVNGFKFAEPVPMQGGHGFMAENADKGAAWASGRSVANRLGNVVRAEAGDAPVYGAYTAMGERSGDFSHHVSDTLSEMFKHSKVAKTPAKAFDAEMSQIAPGWPGIRSPQLKEYMGSAPGAVRSYFAKLMDTAPYQKAGFPSVAEARFATTDPRLLHEPTGASGLSISRMDPSGRTFQDPAGQHLTYDTNLAGEYVGGLPTSVPQEVMFPDIVKHLQGHIDASPSYKPRMDYLMARPPKGTPLVQDANQQWVDGVSQYLEGKGFTLGAGGTDKRAATATAALDLSPEARAARAAEQGFIVDAFHGTHADPFEAFKRKSNDIGVHFGTADQANDRLSYVSSRRGGDPHVYPVKLNVNNPLRLDDLGAWGSDNLRYGLANLRKADGSPVFDPESVRRAAYSAGNEAGRTKALRDLIQSKGYDGIVYKNTGETGGSEPFRQRVEEAKARMNEAFGGKKSSWSREDQQHPTYQEYSKAEKAYEKHRQENAQDSYIAFHPNQVRSKFAEFNPANKDKGFLLGAGATDRKAATATAAMDIFEHAPEAKPTPQMLIDAGQGAQDAYAALHGQAPEPAAVTPALPAATGPDVAGGAGGGVPGLLEAQAAAARRAGTRQALEGLPSKAMKIGDEYFVPGPIGKIHDVAEEYVKGIGRPYEPPKKYHPIDEEHSKAIARAFEEMPHTPNDPATKASYDALIKETLAQYQAIKKTGLKIEPIRPDMPDPYAANPRLAAKDVADNNHLWYFPTDQGFGSGNKALEGPHPMMRDTGETIGDRPLVANDLFRIVHDYFGHLKHGHGFRAAGEDNAWRTHAAMYSDLARPAMTTETRGQNSWVNYGPHGETNRTAKSADTVYADQKVGLMPEWTMRDRGSPEPIIAYHGTPHSFEKFDPAHIGSGEGNQAYGQGLYFAGHEPVSEWYRHQLSARRDPLLPKYGLDAEDGANVGMQIAAHGGDVDAYKAKLEQHLEILRGREDTSKAHKNEIARTEGKIGFLNDAERNPGHLYEVAIDHPPEQMLDWDAPISGQSPAVSSALRALYPDVPDTARRPVGQLYDTLVSQLGPKGATKALKDAGIPGIKYLDQGSRGGGKGTHNYVTFDAPRILRKYALPGAIGAGSFGALGRSRDDL